MPSGRGDSPLPNSGAATLRIPFTVKVSSSMQSSPPNDEFARTLARVHYGSRKALVELADLLPRVKLIIAVDKLPSTGERVRATLLQEADGRTLFPVFSSQTTLRRWGLANDWGTLPAVALFEAILGEHVDALVLDPAGPNRMEIAREVLTTVLNLAHPNRSH